MRNGLKSLSLHVGAAILLALLAGLSLIGTLRAADPSLGVGAASPDERYVDATGAKLRYGMQATRIVSLAPNATEMLFFLGLGPRVVGRSDFCDYPLEAAKLPSIGGFVDASLERIVALRPDLVVAYQGNSRELVDQLRQTGITVLAFKEAASLQEIDEQLLALRNVADVAAGDPPPQLVDWEGRLARLTKRSGKGERPSVFFGYPGEMSMTCGPNSFVDDVIHLAGGRNVVTKTGQRWPSVSAEFVVGAKPQWLLTATSCTASENVSQKRAALLKQLHADPVWSSLPAVKQEHVVVVDSALLLRPGPRILDALEQLVDAMHPVALGKER